MTEATTKRLDLVTDMESREQEARELLIELKERSEEIAQEIAELVVHGKGNGKKAAGLRDKRAEMVLRSEELEDTLPLLEEKIAENREAACRAMATERLASIAAQLSDSAEVQPERIKDLVEAAEEVAFQAQRINGAFANQEQLEGEARALRIRFGLDMPEHGTIELPGREDRVREVLTKVRDLRFPVRRGIVRDQEPGTETGKILATAGPRPLTAAEKEQAERKSEREAQRAERQKREAAELDRFVGGSSYDPPARF